MSPRADTATLLALLAAGALVLAALALPRPQAGTGPEALLVHLATERPEAPLAPEERARILAQLRAAGPRALARLLEPLAGAATAEPMRLAALEALGGCATHAELVTLVRLATPASGAPGPALARALRATVVAALAGDARSFDALVPAWRAAGAELRVELLAALAEHGDPRGLAFLAWVATFESAGQERSLAQASLRLAPRHPGPEARAALERLVPLLASPDSTCVQTLSQALARARIEAALPAWIELLESPSRGVRARALSALEETSGLALGPAAERWRAWLESELSWLEESAPAVLLALESDDDASVLAALRILAGRRLERDELAMRVGSLLAHPAPVVRLAAISTLASLGSGTALRALVQALADEDEAVARRAWAALRAATGLELPLALEPWNAALAIGPGA